MASLGGYKPMNNSGGMLVRTNSWNEKNNIEDATKARRGSYSAPSTSFFDLLSLWNGPSSSSASIAVDTDSASCTVQKHTNKQRNNDDTSSDPQPKRRQSLDSGGTNSSLSPHSPPSSADSSPASFSSAGRKTSIRSNLQGSVSGEDFTTTKGAASCTVSAIGAAGEVEDGLVQGEGVRGRKSQRSGSIGDDEKPRVTLEAEAALRSCAGVGMIAGTGPEGGITALGRRVTAAALEAAAFAPGTAVNISTSGKSVSIGSGTGIISNCNNNSTSARRRRRRRVKFNRNVKVVLIPTKAEYIAAGLTSALYWQVFEYDVMKVSAAKEIIAVMNAVGISDAKEAMRLLYQPLPAVTPPVLVVPPPPPPQDEATVGIESTTGEDADTADPSTSVTTVLPTLAAAASDMLAAAAGAVLQPLLHVAPPVAAAAAAASEPGSQVTPQLQGILSHSDSKDESRADSPSIVLSPSGGGSGRTAMKQSGLVRSGSCNDVAGKEKAAEVDKPSSSNKRTHNEAQAEAEAEAEVDSDGVGDVAEDVEEEGGDTGGADIDTRSRRCSSASDGGVISLRTPHNDLSEQIRLMLILEEEKEAHGGDAKVAVEAESQPILPHSRSMPEFPTGENEEDEDGEGDHGAEDVAGASAIMSISPRNSETSPSL